MAAIEAIQSEGTTPDDGVKADAQSPQTVACKQSVSEEEPRAFQSQSAPRHPEFSNPNVSFLSTQDSTNVSGDNLLCEIPNILTSQEAKNLVYSLDSGLLGREWALEGYDRQNRVQRYDAHADDSDSLDEDDNSNGEGLTERAFGWIFDRIVSNVSSRNKGCTMPILKHRPYEVIVTEHTPSSCRSVVDVFEQFRLCPCRQHNQQTQAKGDASQINQHNTCSCYVAQLTLINNAIQHIEKPQIRDLECWDVATPVELHSTEMTMEENGVLIKTGESLWNWRFRISDVEEKTPSNNGSGVLTGDSSDRNSDALSNEMKNLDPFDTTQKKKSWTRTKKLKELNRRSITISFRGIHPSPERTSTEDLIANAEFLAKQERLASRPLSELLTIVVTTSPIRSNPSTEMLEHTFETFQFAGDEFAFECKKVIVCDGCRVLEENGNAGSDTNAQPKIRIYANGKQNLRNGVATVDQSKKYNEFKASLHHLCEKANQDTRKSSFRNTQVVELKERHGYGFALRHALRHCVNTPYVCVIQHDRNFMRTTPVREVVDAIIRDPMQRIKYVGMSMRSNLMYYDIFSGKYGKRAIDEFKTLILRPKELCIGGNIYGPNGKSVETMPEPCVKNRSKTIETLRDTYRGSHQYLNHMEWVQSTKEEGNQRDDCQQLSLTPTLFWYDNTHIVETAHYRDFIFNPKYKMVARGGFVEDKLSPVITRNVERLGLTEGHRKFGCYLLDDHSGVYFTGHLDGGSYKTAHLYFERKNDESNT
ncbi:hypothetical protein HJC23_005044 [Cyclotella cryptica]|uniref:Uncharacterized protein n=1 Tax=Cyclotella cryptica TaxID=29204 RepID=A0ABD3QF75_9STRA|eukprot:CCRYP_006268-RA/>CCRYP_006268-RA protein AED:0.03 eAED:-0.03 QI:0/-1/0/1/-1/1/1/0/760